MARGLAGFTADVLVQNHGMLRVFHRCGYRVESHMEDGAYHLRIPFTKRRARGAGPAGGA